MSEVLSAKGTIAKIENIVRGANKSVYIVSPYLLIPETLISVLNSAIERNISVNFIHGKRALESKEQERLNQLKKGYNLFFHPKLHGKSYFNEEHAIVTSLNLNEYSERNFEFGIYFKRKENQDLFDQLGQLVKEVIDDSNRFKKIEIGFCIRCGIRINFNSNKPFCMKCFQLWNIDHDKNSIEKHCHCCGVEVSTKINQPFCNSCNVSN